MNLPNKLTIMRICLTPVFMAAMLIDFPHHYLVALIIFVIASITDGLDGYIARSRNLITNFGKFLDPLADKMLTTAALIAFLYKGFGVGIAWVLFIVLFREFVIASIRLIAVSSVDKKVIAANIWGKFKTVTQMVAIILGVAGLYFIETIYPAINLPEFAKIIVSTSFSTILWVSTFFALFSGIVYLKNNAMYINPNN